MGKVIHINDLIHYVEDVGSGPRAICRSGDGHVIREGRITKYICKVTCKDCLKALNINTEESEPTPPQNELEKLESIANRLNIVETRLYGIDGVIEAYDELHTIRCDLKDCLKALNIQTEES